ncbi:hypothetical protein C8Q74DRAFT_1373554 [Fomes fomentarius]|nr:hypothetical protein C8Q74DRAFT_1373554 [Fomes fomentarius]
MPAIPKTISEAVLVTATLVLLLVVSGTIIARTWALRRRQQAAIAEAIANGTYPRSPRGGPGERPKIYQVHISQERAEGEKGAENRSNSMEKLKEKGREHVGSGLIVDWNRMVPMSCRWLKPPERSMTPTPTTPLTSAPTSIPRSHFHWLRWFSSYRQQPLLPVSTPSQSAGSSIPPPARSSSPSARNSQSAELLRASVSSTEKRLPTPEPPPEMVRISVLISMPFADVGRRHTDDAAEAELPYVEFGVADVRADGLGAARDTPTPGAVAGATPQAQVRSAESQVAGSLGNGASAGSGSL